MYGSLSAFLFPETTPVEQLFPVRLQQPTFASASAVLRKELIQSTVEKIFVDRLLPGTVAFGFKQPDVVPNRLSIESFLAMDPADRLMVDPSSENGR